LTGGANLVRVVLSVGRPYLRRVTVFGSIGAPELMLILVIALVIFGPTRLPEIGSGLGQAIRAFRKAADDLQHHDDDTPKAPRP
jgi:TatA/E family protein of Tat protein translocase